MKKQNHNDEEKLNIKTNFIIDDPELSLDDELASEKTNWFVETKKWFSDKSANVYKWFSHHTMFDYTLKRIFYGLVTLLITIIIIFLLVRAVTDDNQYLPFNIDQMGLDEPAKEKLLVARMKAFGVYGSLGTQLGNYLKDLFPLIPKEVPDGNTWVINIDGSVEYSTKTVWLYLGVVYNPAIATPGSDVLDLFNRAVPYTFLYALIAVAVSYLIAIPLGIEAARMKGRTADGIINGLAILLTAIPAVVIVIGIYMLATAGNGTSGLFVSGSFWSKFWPMVTLILVLMPPQIIMTRRYVIDEMSGEYANFALSQGLSNKFVYYVYIFRNAAARTLKQIPIDLVVAMFSTTLLVEQKWVIPGMGRNIVSAIGDVKDSFVIMGYVSFAAFIEIFSSLISDLIIVGLDPRANLNQRH